MQNLHEQVSLNEKHSARVKIFRDKKPQFQVEVYVCSFEFKM